MSAQCPMCGQEFPTRDAFDKHAKIHAAPSIPPFRCAACAISFETQAEYERHMQGHAM